MTSRRSLADAVCSGGGEYGRDQRTGRRRCPTTLLSAYLAPIRPQVGQVAQLTRQVRDKRGTHQEVVYLLTSCTPACLARPRPPT